MIMNGLASRFALGTYAFSGSYGNVAETAAVATIQRYIDSGNTIIDTSDLYGDGYCEKLLGRVIKGQRDKLFLCSKFGFVYGKTMAERRLDARPERVEEACDASLKRMGVESMDLYYLHRVDPSVPVEDTVGAMARLVDKGKIRFLGLCEVGMKTFARAFAVHPVAAIQSEHSIWSPETEAMFDELKRRGTAFFGYSPLGRGFLSGQLKSPEDFPPGDQRRDLPRFQGQAFYKNLELVAIMAETAKELGVTTAQLAVAWCARDGYARPVVGATEPAHVDDACAGVSLTIPAGILAQLENVFSPAAVVGARYPEAAMQRLRAAD